MLASINDGICLQLSQYATDRRVCLDRNGSYRRSDAIHHTVGLTQSIHTSDLSHQVRITCSPEDALCGCGSQRPASHKGPARGAGSHSSGRGWGQGRVGNWASLCLILEMFVGGVLVVSTLLLPPRFPVLCLLASQKAKASSGLAARMGSTQGSSREEAIKGAGAEEELPEPRFPSIILVGGISICLIHTSVASSFSSRSALFCRSSASFCRLRISISSSDALVQFL